MFAYHLNIRHRLSAEQARHFAFTERRSLDWNNHAIMIVLLAVLLGGCAKLFTLPTAAIALTLGVAVAFVQDRPGHDTPVWLGRLSLVCTAVFYAGLGYCLGAVAVALAPALLALQRAAFR